MNIRATSEHIRAEVVHTAARQMSQMHSSFRLRPDPKLC